MDDWTWNDVWVFAEAYVLPVVIRLMIAFAVFFVGRLITKLVVRAAHKVMDRSSIDTSLKKFLSDLIYAVMLVAVVVASLDTLGIKTTAVVAVLGAAGLAIGLALQGSLSNFAAGVMIIILRPYKVGDTVVIGKYEGKVEAIKVFNTVLITSDHREITIPNGKIISDSIENMTALGTRRVNVVVTVPHGTNLHDARQWLEAVARSDRRVHPTPAPTIDIAEVTVWGVKLHVRPWTSADDYNAVAADTLERIKDALDQHGVKFSAALQ